MKELKIGDRVRMSTKWCRNTGQFAGPPAPTRIGPHARGCMTGWQMMGDRKLGIVTWDDGEESKVLVCNLEGERAPVQ